MDRYNANEALNVQLGQAGYDIIGSGGTINQTTNPGVTWVAITVLVGNTEVEDEYHTAVITATSVDTNLWDSPSSLVVPVGVTIYGRWSLVTAGTGDTIIAYRG